MIFFNNDMTLLVAKVIKKDNFNFFANFNGAHSSKLPKNSINRNFSSYKGQKICLHACVILSLHDNITLQVLLLSLPSK